MPEILIGPHCKILIFGTRRHLCGEEVLTEEGGGGREWREGEGEGEEKIKVWNLYCHRTRSAGGLLYANS